MENYLAFEQPVAELTSQLRELRRLADTQNDDDIGEDVTRLEKKRDKRLAEIYKKLTPWQKVQVARHPQRPRFKTYIANLFKDFTPLAGDRNYAEDFAIVGGLARFQGQSCVILGQERGGNTTKSRIHHNFGMGRPEGYRKAQRLFDLANHFKLPMITLVDTAGAYPGKGAEERGQAEAIARSMHKSLEVRVPVISLVIGEGGSGGAIAIATANHVHMLEHAVYSVISPEGCASILWRSANEAKTAAEAMRLTAQDLFSFGVIDSIVPEPIGAAHRDPDKMVQTVGETIKASLATLLPMNPQAIMMHRREKFLAISRNLPS